LSDDRKKGRQTRVPSGRVERLARMGWMAGEFAVGGLAEGAKRLVGALPVDPASVFLSGERAQKLASRLSQMRGAAMKLSQVRRVLGRAYGKGWEARFREFDFEPLAAASIGQVHAAVTADGRDLALKIQYPGVARSIDSDVNNLAGILRMTRILPVEVDIREIIVEAKRQLKQEADYEREAQNLMRYRELVADESAVLVPRVHDDFTTKRVLAMDRALGRPIEELRGAEYPQSLRDDLGRLLQRLTFRELFEFGFMQTDPNFANYLFDPDSGRLVLLDFGSAREYSAEFSERYKQICRGMITQDIDAIRRAATDIGYLSGNEPEGRAKALADLISMAGEPLRHEGVYDFEASGLAARARDAGFDLVFREGFMRAPPPETIFLHRKLAGTFLLCSHIRARIDTRALITPYLGDS
jgi:predicted unusual protein kinase regulating ubiquinone biosynthesis (AarF/ABC1/UbiB family)